MIEDTNGIVPIQHAPERLDKAGIPLRFRDRTFKKFKVTDENTDAFLWANKFAELYTLEAASALLVGKPGTGKTHLAVAICLDALLTEFVEQVLYTTVDKAVRRVKASFSKTTDDTEEKARQSLTSPRLLVLDEVGVQFGTDFETNLFFGVLNQRYEDMKPTILISNLPTGECATFLGDRVFDRFREDNSKIVEFDWDSHRGKE